MSRLLRTGLLLGGLVLVVFTAGFFFQQAWATLTFPFPSSRLSNIFISSILAAMAAPILWIGLTGEMRAMAGGALNLGVMYAGFAFLAFLVYSNNPQPGLAIFGGFSFLMLLICAVLFIYSSRFQFQDRRPIPYFVRISFGLFAVLLAFTGFELITKRSNIFPWPISPENSVLYGWIFLGAMCYFVYALIFPYWLNARGQLLGFLAYDLVLIVPFLLHFQDVQPQYQLSLQIYTGVLIYSGLVAIYYLFIHAATRFEVRRRARSTMPTSL